MHKIDGSDPQHAPNMASSCLPALGEYGAAGYCQGAMAERELPEKGLPHSTCCLYVVRIEFCTCKSRLDMAEGQAHT